MSVFVKDVELKLISQLMKNARRSGELAKLLGVSQHAATRTTRASGLRNNRETISGSKDD